MRKNVTIIAEAGVNHNGDFNLAKHLIRSAAEAGVDFIKFQTFKADNIVTKSAVMASYQKNNISKGDESQYSMLKKLEIPNEWYNELIKYSAQQGVSFLSTGFDDESIDLLDNLNSPLFKIASGEITNKPLLKHIAQKGKPIIMSSGMANLNEIIEAINVLIQNGISKDMITVLHCNSEYPTPMEDVNLKAMINIHNALGVRTGYSDHTIGIEVAIAAVALGAVVIEKHFTIDRNLTGPDHKASIEPQELALMVKSIRNIELAISGNGLKELSKSENININLVRKSIVASKYIKLGEVFTVENLTTKRPGLGISPMLWEEVLGKKAIKDFVPDDLIEI